MIDPNKVQWTNSPIYEPPSPEKPKALSDGISLTTSRPETLKTEKKGFNFLSMIEKFLSSLSGKKDDITNTVKHQTLADRLMKKDDKPFDSTSLSKGEKLTAAYASILTSSNTVFEGNVEGFERGTSTGSIVRADLGKHASIKSLGQELVSFAKKNVVAIDIPAFETICEEGQVAMPGYKGKDGPSPLTPPQINELATTVHNNVDDCMTSIFGTPGDPESTFLAASRYPQSICDVLAIQFKAIDDSSAPQDLKAGMKLKIARDTLALRSLNPVLVNAVSKSPLGPERSSVMQLSKAIQSLVNGAGLSGSNLPPQLTDSSAQLGTKWKDHFADFVTAIVDRADPKTVEKHVNLGRKVADLMT